MNCQKCSSKGCWAFSGGYVSGGDMMLDVANTYSSLYRPGNNSTCPPPNNAILSQYQGTLQNQGPFKINVQNGGRKSPEVSATKHPGKKMKGLDGNMWESRKSGKSFRWFRVNKSTASKKKPVAPKKKPVLKNTEVVKKFNEAYKLYKGELNLKLAKKFGFRSGVITPVPMAFNQHDDTDAKNENISILKNFSASQAKKVEKFLDDLRKQVSKKTVAPKKKTTVPKKKTALKKKTAPKKKPVLKNTEVVKKFNQAYKSYKGQLNYRLAEKFGFRSGVIDHDPMAFIQYDSINAKNENISILKNFSASQAKKVEKFLDDLLKEVSKKKTTPSKKDRLSASEYYKEYGEEAIGDIVDIRNNGELKCLLKRSNGTVYWANKSKSGEGQEQCGHGMLVNKKNWVPVHPAVYKGQKIRY